MGAVFLAEDDSLCRPVAIKVISGFSPDDHAARQLFLNEAKAMARVAHPNVVHVYNHGETDGLPYIVMEYVEGGSLAGRLRGDGALRENVAVSIVTQTLSALEAAWDRGIVHRDIKPSNILIQKDGLIRVCDFGVARPVPADVSSAPTISGRPAGTPHYMSPEQASGQRTDFRSDIYSLGIVLFEMLVGRPPFSSKSPLELMTKHLHEPRPGLEDARYRVTPEVSALYEWMTKREPAERPDSYARLREQIEALGDVPAPTPVSVPAWSKVAYAAVAAALVVTAMIIGNARVPGGDVPTIPGQPQVSAPQFAHLISVADFENRAVDPELDALGASLRGEVQSALIGGLGGFIVVPRTFGSAGEQWAPAAAPDLMFEGFLEKKGELLRAGVRLRNLENDEVLAERVVESAEQDSAALVLQLVEAAVETLRAEFGEVTYVARAPQNPDGVAYISYWNALEILERAETAEAIDDAIGLLLQATAKDPNFVGAKVLLGTAMWRKYRITGDESLAVRAQSECTDAVVQDDALAEAYICLGRIHAHLGRNDEAAASFYRAIELGAVVEAHRGLGYLSANLHNRELAEDYLKSAWNLNPTYPGAYSSLGWFYARQGKYDEAAGWYEDAVRWAPDSARSLSSLGAIYYLGGRYDEAIASLRESIAKTPSPDAYSNLGLCYLAKGEFARAIEVFEEAESSDYADYVDIGNLARAYRHIGDDRAGATFARAVEAAARVHNMNTDAWAPRILLAYYHVMLGDEDVGGRYLEDVLDTNPDENEVHFWAAIIYLELGEPDKALAAVEEARRLNYSLSEIRDATELQELADEPRFRALLEAQ